MLANTLRIAFSVGLCLLASTYAGAQDLQSPAVEPYGGTFNGPYVMPSYGPYYGPYNGTMPVVISPQTATVDSAIQVLADVTAIPERGIPHVLLGRAQAVAIIPNVIKVGFIAGIRHGNGVILIRDAQGNWGPPQFVTLTGGSFGFQAGALSTDVVLIFRNRESVDAMMRGKITLGADAAVAAGPVGRQAEIGTDVQLRAEIYSYSRTRGLFVGVALDGASLKTDPAATQIYYARGEPTEAARLQEMLTNLSRPDRAAQLTPVTTAQAIVQPPAPQMPTPAADSPAETQQHLASSWQALSRRLDDPWRRYLALPPEVFQPGKTANVEALGKSLQAYQSVAENPQYRVVADMPEFQATLAWLRKAIVAQVNAPTPAAGASGVTLPPPPGH